VGSETHPPKDRGDHASTFLMPIYEVKAFVNVEARNEDEAISRAGLLLDQLPDPYRRFTYVEGDHEAVEIGDPEAEDYDALPLSATLNEV